MLLDAAHLTFSYGEQPVLHDVSLRLAAGEVVALLGPNGTGKSTLLRALLGQLHAAGKVEWDGRAVRSWKRWELARRVAYLPQSPVSDPHQRVADVLRTGRAPYWGAFGIESVHDLQVVRDVAKTVEMTHLLDRTMGELSGGQRQLAFVARCLVQQPAALLLDEPNTFLDLKHQVELTTLLRRLARETGIAVLMASHDINLAGGSADRLILLKDGRVEADGTPDQVFDPELVGKVYGLPMRRIDLENRSAPLIFPA
jgi:iron complex transport system ATP-binding protein